MDGFNTTLQLEAEEAVRVARELLEVVAAQRAARGLDEATIERVMASLPASERELVMRLGREMAQVEMNCAPPSPPTPSIRHSFC